MHIVHRKSAFCSSFSFLKQIQKNNYKNRKKKKDVLFNHDREPSWLVLLSRFVNFVQQPE